MKYLKLNQRVHLWVEEKERFQLVGDEDGAAHSGRAEISAMQCCLILSLFAFIF